MDPTSSSIAASITPVVNTTTTTALTAKISDVRIKLGEQAWCQVTLFDSNGNAISRQNGNLTPTQYNAWGMDDNYFVQSVLANLSITCPTGPF